ncbi:hypothetical protein HME9302_01656 [Alteripontixanthobacter maritimus]|uniref:ER-bound oxygenase mpaB/mpaB'/Rubber oxygenase catalytic domain-containing protein n=1 Tax=Alteripontixanthobacter maritimus TaxID=2161824 RepID=A0A369QC06_9SPHN|nr:oxygenase MpaB family protein [Alteripontixanthobacter maritimus]RDC60449.1 hypothetical protein HME9302_01656 [Alteripontixanthobacter maritimus]
MARPDPSEILRQQLVKRVRAVFNDEADGQQPVPPSENALFPKDSPIRMVHADATSMMVGGIRSLLLQMLHPHALQGVLDHSNFREDMHGRLRNTARFIAVTTFGDRDAAMAAIERVNRIHTHVHGILPDGTPYSATNPRTLAWVHVAEATSFLAAWKYYVRPAMPRVEQDEYYHQFAIIARALGADPVPKTVSEADALFREMRSELRATREARQIADLVLNQRPEGAPVAVQKMLGTAAVDMLPPFATQMLRLNGSTLGAIPAKLAVRGIGRTLRWAFKQG